jgi:hypothetical protein
MLRLLASTYFRPEKEKPAGVITAEPAFRAIAGESQGYVATSFVRGVTLLILATPSPMPSATLVTYVVLPVVGFVN